MDEKMLKDRGMAMGFKMLDSRIKENIACMIFLFEQYKQLSQELTELSNRLTDEVLNETST